MRLLLALVFLFQLGTMPIQVLACECDRKRTIEDEIKNSTIVFVGIVISKQSISTEDNSTVQYPFIRYQLVTQKIYKGKTISDTIFVSSGIGHGDCGFWFEIGKKYIVYGYEKDHFTKSKIVSMQQTSCWTNSCLRTTLYNQSEIDLIKQYTEKKP